MKQLKDFKKITYIKHLQRKKKMKVGKEKKRTIKSIENHRGFPHIFCGEEVLASNKWQYKRDTRIQYLIRSDHS